MDIVRGPKSSAAELAARAPTPAAFSAKEWELQRNLTERLLLSALRSQDDADAFEGLENTAAFLRAEGLRLGESLDEDATLKAIAGITLPRSGTWTIVEMFDDKRHIQRLGIVHPVAGLRPYLDEIENSWIPTTGDRFGLFALLAAPNSEPVSTSTSAMGGAATDPDTLKILLALGVGYMYTVPLVVRDVLVGAITFVEPSTGVAFSSRDKVLAADLAGRAALALDRARLHAEAAALRAHVEEVLKAESIVLGTMGHELRSPLNAIGGYVELLDLGIHGPINDAQREDLSRIRSNQRYLSGLINDILSLAQSSGSVPTDSTEVVNIRAVLEMSIALVEPLFAAREISFDMDECDESVAANGVRERVVQILVNLLSNAIKFTPVGGRVSLSCLQTESVVSIMVTDTGIGIPPEKLAVIFEPFVQVRAGGKSGASGVGLGLAISCNLAHAMHGDLHVASELGKGSRFTLTLPCARG